MKPDQTEKEIEERLLCEPHESSDDEQANDYGEARKTWEFGELLGFTTPARSETIKKIAEIRRSARLVSKSKAHGT